ncbi:DNA adenine methylase [Dysgonomonas sp. HGC4]|uniref:DNA adenine methylase n=1 Tax=Dysgonomonas sp. HGC4 TaxID=1658009 RepID=UPI0006803E37|nr:DNA adenine methylase [Dysgonomonas sp. HGC4]MBD8348566.1 DNA adenine methylase [Dysgonomonas sp. HGC4]
MKKNYTTAPLPFQGQKRRFINAFGLAMTELKAKQEVKIIVDLFGGSGLLSHTAKKIFPEAKVIYNDFDNYSLRLKNIAKTNKLLADLRLVLGVHPREKKIPAEVCKTMLDRIEIEDNAGFVDYITLSSSLLFSSKYVTDLKELKSETLYNNIKASDYDVNSTEYLAGLDIVKCDYRQLYNQYKDVSHVLFLVDPPYLSTDTKTYQSDKYWKLRDYLDVLNVLCGSNYFFFTSNKSSLIELCEWFADNRDIGNPFKNSVLNTQNITLNKSAGYTDMMLYKFVKV